MTNVSAEQVVPTGQAVPTEPSLLVSVAKTLRGDVKSGVFSFAANTIGGSALVPRVARAGLLRLLGVQIGRAQVRPEVRFTTPNVRIGNRSMVNRQCFFDSQGGVTLGERVHVGYGVLFCTSTHQIGPSAQRCGAEVIAPVVIEDGCWIGAGALILPGVTVRKGCVVAAGAVVTKDCDEHGVYAGTPARRIRDLDPA